VQFLLDLIGEAATAALCWSFESRHPAAWIAPCLISLGVGFLGWNAVSSDDAMSAFFLGIATPIPFAIKAITTSRSGQDED
jgi:hypothetical protein